MGDADEELLAFQPVQGLAQGAAADAIGAGKFGLGDFAAWGDLALDDGGLDLAQHVVGQRLARGGGGLGVGI